MSDLIDRQRALYALDCDLEITGVDNANVVFEYVSNAIRKIKELPSVEPDIKYRKQGEWEMFELITTAWYGKQCYSKDDNDSVYSRRSTKNMSVHDAILEFLREIGDG